MENDFDTVASFLHLPSIMTLATFATSLASSCIYDLLRGPASVRWRRVHLVVEDDVRQRPLVLVLRPKSCM
ncbi:hypothetical protein NUW54_g14663 [Trametes sanguinea]|uniref:Uncharacterized protein n=1 Tax=Trametes sanguinea TaxID=158606 RepID=A0ACC1MAX4_9APHY|nr:hypothetical protein NUW54_g14663 [Trametes sanguinea]